VLVTGANRGLGLEFVRQYKADGWDVIATARASSPELDQLGVQTDALDMGDLDAVAGFGRHIDQLDLLIANAGTYGPKDASSSSEAAEWLDTFAVNTVAPYLLAKSLARRMQDGGKLIVISTRMGSLEDNGSGGFLAYRSSKTALNMAWRNLAHDVRGQGLIATMLHPGWVQTRMGGSNAPVTPADSIGGMRRVIDRLGPADSGKFFDYQGQTVPW
jgi:NAD(P)-dependent dehydrogenase (short-subunit alcohol dehydrogenase family)